MQLSSQGLRLLHLSGDYQQAVIVADRVARATDVIEEGADAGQEGRFRWERRVTLVPVPEELTAGAGPGSACTRCRWPCAGAGAERSSSRACAPSRGRWRHDGGRSGAGPLTLPSPRGGEGGGIHPDRGGARARHRGRGARDRLRRAARRAGRVGQGRGARGPARPRAGRARPARARARRRLPLPLRPLRLHPRRAAGATPALRGPARPGHLRHARSPVPGPGADRVHRGQPLERRGRPDASPAGAARCHRARSPPTRAGGPGDGGGALPLPGWGARRLAGGVGHAP